MPGRPLPWPTVVALSAALFFLQLFFHAFYGFFLILLIVLLIIAASGTPGEPSLTHPTRPATASVFQPSPELARERCRISSPGTSGTCPAVAGPSTGGGFIFQFTQVFNRHQRQVQIIEGTKQASQGSLIYYLAVQSGHQLFITLA